MCYRLLLLFYIATSTLSGAPPLSPIRASDYSYAYWQNSWRKYDDQNFKDILCFETDRFGMKLDIQDIAHPRLGLINSPSNHLDTLTTGIDRLKSLPKGHLHLEIEQGGSTYKLVSCQAAEESGPRRLASVRMWEAGMLSQNFDIQQLIFKNEKDQILATDSTLQFIVWPDSLTLNAHISPSHHYKQGTTMGITGNGICLADKSVITASPPTLTTVENAPTTSKFVVWDTLKKRHGIS